MTKTQQSKPHNKAEKAMREAVLKIVKEHKKTGASFPAWKNGRVADISAKQIKLS